MHGGAVRRPKGRAVITEEDAYHRERVEDALAADPFGPSAWEREAGSFVEDWDPPAGQGAPR